MRENVVPEFAQVGARATYAFLWRGSWAKLKGYARQVLAHPPELTGLLQTSLTGEINLYRCLTANINQIEREVAQQLAKTPGAMMTTIQGIGITLAAGVAAELGPPASQPSTRRLSSYAGIIPRVKQTGGPEKGAKVGGVSRRSNHILKDFIVQCGNHLGQHGPIALKEDHRRRGAHKQHADFGMARRFLRLGMCLMRNNDSYVPPELRHKDNPLGQWRKRIEEIYAIELPLPKK